MNILVTGASSGVGFSCVDLLRSQGHVVTGWDSKICDFDHPERIFEQDLSGYGMIINCAGHGQGHQNTFLKNTWQNQLSQIMVNYAANVLLFKHYVNSTAQGRYVWIGTRLSLAPNQKPWQAVYSSSKAAGAIAIEAAALEQSHVTTLEVQLGLTRSNFRQRSYESNVCTPDIEQAWANGNALTADQAAQRIINAAFSKINKVVIE
jgi:short-subunit dehydrogenase